MRLGDLLEGEFLDWYIKTGKEISFFELLLCLSLFNAVIRWLCCS
jgi:hypothetical protein